MKNWKIFITKMILPLLLLVSFIGTKYVLAAESPIVIKTDITENIENKLILDLYKVSDIEWKGAEANYLFKPLTDFNSVFDSNVPTLFTKNTEGYYFIEDTAKPKTYDFVNEKMMEGGFADSIIDIVKTKTAGFKEIEFTKTDSSYSATVSFNATDNVDDRGLYLLFVRGDTYPIKDAFEKKTILGSTESHYASLANSADYVYSFKPYLLFYDGTSNLDREFKIQVKYQKDFRFGKLKIEKEVDEFINRNETFVFRVEANKTNDFTNPEYVKSVSINIKNNTLDKPVILEDIHMYYYVRVIEEYDGASYKIDDEKNRIQITQIVPENSDGVFATVKFKNVVDDLNKKGYGVNNSYVSEESTNSTTGEPEISWQWSNDLN